MNHKSSSERMGEALERARGHWQRKAPPAPSMPVEMLSAVLARTPVVALSREAGTNGGSVARALGKRLGWPVYDRELIQLIADEMELRTQLVESVDEKQTHWLRECLEAFSSAPSITSNSYVRHLSEIILSLASHAGCVIVGRGAAQLLPPESTFRVRLVAPLRDRVANIERRFGISHEDAQHWIEKTDRERAHFVTEFFQKDPTDPRHYDLVLNVARFSVDECAEILHEALKVWRSHEQAPGPKPKPAVPVAC